jgi:hypothetical protein
VHCSIDVSPVDLARIKQRCADGFSVMALRSVVIGAHPHSASIFCVTSSAMDSSRQNSTMPRRTEHLIDEQGQPTRAALHQVSDFLRSRLQVS